MSAILAIVYMQCSIEPIRPIVANRQPSLIANSLRTVRVLFINNMMFRPARPYIYNFILMCTHCSHHNRKGKFKRISQCFGRMGVPEISSPGTPLCRLPFTVTDGLHHWYVQSNESCPKCLNLEKGKVVHAWCHSGIGITFVADGTIFNTYTVYCGPCGFCINASVNLVLWPFRGDVSIIGWKGNGIVDLGGK